MAITSIKFDKTNPNEVSDEQMQALTKGMERFGYLAPVILNENMQVLDGEHRVKIYKKLGEKKIPAYVIKASKLDGKLLRQIMNKMRGEHIIEKDVPELELLLKDRPDDLRDLLLFKERDLGDMQELLKAPDQSTWDNVFNQEDTSLEENMEQITFYLDIGDKKHLLETLKTIDKEKDVALIKMMKQWKKNSS